MDQFRSKFKFQNYYRNSKALLSPHTRRVPKETLSSLEEMQKNSCLTIKIKPASSCCKIDDLLCSTCVLKASPDRLRRDVSTICWRLGRSSVIICRICSAAVIGANRPFWMKGMRRARLGDSDTDATRSICLIRPILRNWNTGPALTCSPLLESSS